MALAAPFDYGFLSELVGRKVLMFSYGSGAVATAFCLLGKAAANNALAQVLRPNLPLATAGRVCLPHPPTLKNTLTIRQGGEPFTLERIQKTCAITSRLQASLTSPAACLTL